MLRDLLNWWERIQELVVKLSLRIADQKKTVAFRRVGAVFHECHQAVSSALVLIVKYGEGIKPVPLQTFSQRFNQAFEFIGVDAFGVPLQFLRNVVENCRSFFAHPLGPGFIG